MKTLRSSSQTSSYEFKSASYRTVWDWTQGVRRLIKLWKEPSASLVEPTPYRLLFREPLVSLRDYSRRGVGEKGVRLRPAVLFIPPLMVRPLVYDLREEHSFVSCLLDGGLDVYLLDLGEPKKEDSSVRLKDYVLRWLPKAIDAIEAEGKRPIFLTGYCMGGWLATCYLATRKDPRIAGLCTIGTPFDATKVGRLFRISQVLSRPIRSVASQLGNVPAWLSRSGFQMISPMSFFRRYLGLLANLEKEEHLRSFRSMQIWMTDFVDYPGQTFQDFFHAFFHKNQLMEGTLHFEGEEERTSLQTIACPIFAFAGNEDILVHADSVRPILHQTKSNDVQMELVSGGHIGMIAGAKAPEETWKPLRSWLLHHAASVSASASASPPLRGAASPPPPVLGLP